MKIIRRKIEMRKPGRPRGTSKNGMKYLSEEQVKDFLSAIRRKKNIRDDLMFTLTLFLGLRVSELIQLKLTDFYFPSCQLKINPVKNGRERTYNLEGQLWQKIKRWLRKRKMLPNVGNNIYLFPGRPDLNKSITIDGAKRLFKVYAQRAGIPSDFSIHCLRHTCAIQRARAGDSPYRVMLWLRHKSILSTEIYFDQIKFENDDKRAKEVFEDYL